MSVTKPAAPHPRVVMRQLLARSQALSEAGDFAGVCRLLQDAPAETIHPRALLCLAIAAMEARSAPALHRAVALTMGTILPPHIRLGLARHFALGGHAAVAWHALLADPAILGAPQPTAALVPILGRIVATAQESSVRTGAQAALQRLAPDRVEPARSGAFRFPRAPLSPEAPQPCGQPGR